MNELTTALEQPLSAWIVKGTATSSNFAFRVEAGPTDQSAIMPGDWSLVLDGNDHITAVGRILRIRSDIKGRTIYCDQFQTIHPEVPLSNPGLTIPTAPVRPAPSDQGSRATDRRIRPCWARPATRRA